MPIWLVVLSLCTWHRKMVQWVYVCGTMDRAHFQTSATVLVDTLPMPATGCRVPKADILKMMLSLLEPANRLSNGHANGHTANGAVHAQPGNSSSSTDEQKVKLSQLLAADGTTTDKYFAERHVIDVLEEFASAHPTVQQLLTVLRQLQPRLYSISSSPLEKPQHVQVNSEALFVAFITLVEPRSRYLWLIRPYGATCLRVSCMLRCASCMYPCSLSAMVACASGAAAWT